MIRLLRLVRFGVILVWYAGRMSLSGFRLSEKERVRYVALLQQRGGLALCRSIGVNVELDGSYLENRPVLVVSNHLGLLDPWVLSSQFRVAFAAKIEMEAWPIFGWVGRSTGLIYVDRERRMNTGGFVEKIRQRMRDGIGVLVFPEGTTNATDDLLPFKTGGFAAVAGMPDGYVLPVFMWAKRINGVGTKREERRRITWPEGDSMLKNAWGLVGMQSITIEVKVGDLISTAEKDRKRLAKMAQDQVEGLRRLTFVEGN